MLTTYMPTVIPPTPYLDVCPLYPADQQLVQDGYHLRAGADGAVAGRLEGFLEIAGVLFHPGG